MPRRRNERVNGPYKHRQKWRVNHVKRDGTVTAIYYESQGEAEEAVEKARAELAREQFTVGKMIDAYIEHCRTKGNRGRPASERSLKTTRYRLEGFFGNVDVPATTITRRRCQRLYDRMVAETKTVTEGDVEVVVPRYSVDTHRNTLGQVKTFARWAVRRGHWRTSPVEEIEGIGRRSTGKEQLNADEARTFADHCLEHAGEDDSAIAALLCLVVGLRAGQACGLTARDVAADGRWIQIGKKTRKTKAGQGRRVIPGFLAPHLVRLRGAAGEPIFGGDRQWLYRSVKRLCKAAGVPVVTPHGLRGTHASLAEESGATALDVARNLGHSSTQVGRRHYTREDAAAASKMDRALAELGLGGRDEP